MSNSPPRSPFWQPEDPHQRQDSILLNKVSHGSRQDWEHWPSLDTSYHTHTNSTSPPHPHPPDTTTDKTTPNDERQEHPYHQAHPKCTLKTVLLNWWSEILWLSFATTNLTLIAILLSLLSNNPLTTWKFPISINAVVSAMMIATKAALIYTSATCIGQLKWHHFQHSLHGHCIHDLKLFDEASKGPLGAIKLLARARKVNIVALIGGVIITTAVFMETFGQQVLVFVDRKVEVSGAEAMFPSTQTLAGEQGWYLDYVMMSDLQKLLLTSIFRGDGVPGFGCGSGECTWPGSATLGICSRCRDVTATSDGSCEGDSKSLDCEYRTPEGVELGGNVQPGGPMPLINTTTVDGVYDATPSFYNFSTLVVAANTNWTAKLTTCELSWCAWAYENATSRGTDLDLGIARQFPLQFAGTWDKTNDTSNLVDTQSVCTATGDYPAELNNTFTISQGKEYFLKYAVRLILKAGYQGADFYTQLTLATSSLDYTDTTAMSSNLAAFMTNALRTQDGMQSVGTAWESVTFIEVRWVWLLLPAAVVLGSAILLGLTIAQSTRHGTVLWKTSLLAFLFCSTHAWIADTVARDDKTRSLSSMEKASKKMEARLERDEQGRYQLVQI